MDSLSELEAKDSAPLYFQLSEQFINLQQILQAMRGQYVQLINQAQYTVLSSGKSTLPQTFIRARRLITSSPTEPLWDDSVRLRMAK